MIRIIKRRSIRGALTVLAASALLVCCEQGRVALDEEYVTIRVDSGYTVHVKVRCFFKNTSSFSAPLAFPVSDWVKMENFKALWNGEECAYELVTAPGSSLYSINGRHYRSVLKYSIPCTGSDRSEHVITYSYRMPYIAFEKDYESEGYYLEYILNTGALWYGRVSRLRVRVIFDQGVRVKNIITLDGAYRGGPAAGNTWVYDADNVELDRDIRMLLICK